MSNQNKLLLTLPEDDLALILKGSELVYLNASQSLNTAGTAISFVYFPINCLISLVHTVDGKSLEAGLIGNEGMLGTPVFLGARQAACGANVEISGEAYRIPIAVFLDLIKDSQALRVLMNRYILVVMERLTIAIGCHHFHSLEQRLAYLLLIIGQGIRSNTIQITQTLISNLLGVRRAGVSEAARQLQAKTIIEYTRGSIEILDTEKLKKEACNCYHDHQKSYHWIESLSPHL
jgi:CRP-like cAMP-binding protein